MDKSRVERTIFFIEKISFSLKLFSGDFYGQSFIKTVRGPYNADIWSKVYLAVGVDSLCNCSMFCCTLLYVHFSIAIILMGKRELIALLNLSSWCLVMVERLFLTVPRGCLQFVIVVFPGHTHLLFLQFSFLLAYNHHHTQLSHTDYIRNQKI